MKHMISIETILIWERGKKYLLIFISSKWAILTQTWACSSVKAADYFVLSSLSFSCKWQTKATTQPRWHHWPLWTLHPLLPLLPSPPPPPLKPIIWPPALHQASFLSLGANLHYWVELSYCVDSTAWLLQERAWLSVDMGIMRWLGFRGQFTHCLKSISRNISLVDCPFCSAEGPLRPSQSISVQIYLQLALPHKNHIWSLACCYTAEFIAQFHYFFFLIRFF